ncbi:pilus assembly protein TadG-related protein [Shinella sp. NM-101]|uniref:pilus assembly protein TadG-related protein n=1 Tax=Shinella sp. NM-101 TaxID=2744455 RepID=UPI001F34C41B|nr:pilus assembly protein TadG-related protein [Shinella sp. NM-101]
MTPSRLLADRSGNIGTLAALSLPLMIFSLALGVDYGYLTVQQRQLQASADLAAIAAASNVTEAEKAAATYFALNRLSVTVTGRNGVTIPSTPPGVSSAARASVERGRYIADPDIAPEDRFTPAGAEADAARVTLSRPADLFVAGVFMPQSPLLSATGSASRTKIAAFSIGTRLASLNEGILNALLGQLLGTSLSLKVMDYRALVDADLSVQPFLKAVATQLNLTAGTYEEVLNAGITMPQLLASMRAVEGLSGPVRSALHAIEKAAAGSKVKLPLTRILNIDPKKGVAVTTGGDWEMSVNALQMVTAAAALANGRNQVALDTGITLPGLAGVTVSLAIGEPPVETPPHRLGAPGSAVRSAQTRLAVEVGIDGLAALAGLRVKLPLYVEVAASEAKLADIRCLGGATTNANVFVDAVPGVAELAVGKVDPSVLSDFSDEPRVRKARLVDTALLSIDALAHGEVKNLTKTRLTYTPTEIAAKATKSVSTRDTLTSAIKSLLGDLDVEVNIKLLNLALNTSLVTKALASTLTTVTPAIDELLYNLLLAVGVKVGEADIRVTGVRCQRPALVQ